MMTPNNVPINPHNELGVMDDRSDGGDDHPSAIVKDTILPRKSKEFDFLLEDVAFPSR